MAATMITNEDLKFLNSKLTFLPQLTKEEMDIFLTQTSPVNFQKDMVIYNNSTECLGVLIVKKGMLRAHMLSEQGKDITLYRLADGDVCVLSASCVLKNITFDVNIQAEIDTDAYLIKSCAFQRLMEHNIYVENFSYRTTIDRFSDVMWTMEQILFMSFDKRLAVFLLDESVKQKQDIIPLTHAQIAKYIGSAREVVSRMLKHFEEDGIVSLTRGGIEILDKKKLKSIV